VLDESVPHLLIDGRIFDRRVGKDECLRIDDFLGIGRQICDQIAISVAVSLVEGAARAIFLRECHYA
jgi:hypothetical protein